LTGHLDYSEQRCAKRRSQKVSTVVDLPDADDPVALRKQVNGLQDALLQATRSLTALSVGSERSQATNASVAASNPGSVSSATQVPSLQVPEQTTYKKRLGRENG